MPVKRAFVAIRLPAALGTLSDALRPWWPAQGVAWVRLGGRPPTSKWSGDLPRLPVPVEAVELLESILEPTGAVYRPLHQAVLL